MSAALPSPGQVVLVRSHRYVVRDVRPSALPPQLGSPDAHRSQHLLDLGSVEDDRHGESLQVIWELEPGTLIFERASLPEPEGFDSPERLDAFLDAVRWGAISSADARALQAPFRSGITIEDYQLDPVVRALRMPRVNLLVADDVGLGKTIEAGLVAQELLLRHRARSILVVCPASLCIKWQTEMRDRFGLEFRIVDRALMARLRRERGIHTNPWTHFPRLITSVDYLKRDGPMRKMRDVLPAPGEPSFPRRFDLLIVDEAHNVAPAGRSAYAVDSRRTQAVRELAPHFEHKLFLTATPHNGYTNSFSALLELLDDQRFHRTLPPDPAQLSAVMVRRLKRDLPPRWDGSRRFPQRELRHVAVQYGERDRRAHEALRRYTQLRSRAAADDAARYATDFVLKLLKKRLFSSPLAFYRTLEKHLEAVASGRTGRRKLGLRAIQRRLDSIDEDYADDHAYEEAANDGVRAATQTFGGLSPEESALLEELRGWARWASARPDAKLEALLAWIDEHLRPGGTWNDRRLIIFTEYRATRQWLQERFAEAGLRAGDRLALIYGGMDDDKRERVKAAFQAAPSEDPVRVLLATDAASEGIDLQNRCADLFHYEIPWNPTRLEQRNGRIDRHGQREGEVRVHHFVGSSFADGATSRRPGDLDGDLEFLMRVALKVEQIRDDLLGKVGPVLAGQVTEAMLGRRDAIDTRTAERQSAHVRRLLKIERELAHDLERLRDRLAETTRDLRLSPDAVRRVVEVGLSLARQPELMETELEWVWPDSEGRRARSPAFRVPALSGEGWARCREGLAHPHSGEERPITFDHRVAAGRDDVVLAHLNHRLVQLCLHLLRAEVWRPGEQAGLHRVTATMAPPNAIEDPIVIAHGRLVVLGSDGTRLHEEVIAAGGRIRAGRFARLGVGEVARVEAAAPPAMPEPEVLDRLKGLWPTLSEPLLRALEARRDQRLAGMERLLDERRDKETADIRAVLEELARRIEEELRTDEGGQLLLTDPDEQTQLERERSSLRPRLDAIPAEIARESAAIAARYAERTPRLFPVSVRFVLPHGFGP